MSEQQTEDFARAAQMVQHIEHVRGLVEQHQKAQAAQVQAYQQVARQQFDQYAKSADADFDAYAKSQGVSNEQLGEIQREAVAIMRESVTDAQIHREWNNNYLLRSPQGQRILMEAARYRIAQRGVRQKLDRTAPVVQRPGSPAEIAPPSDYEYARLSEKLDRSTGRDALKAAAELVTARRARRR